MVLNGVFLFVVSFDEVIGELVIVVVVVCLFGGEMFVWFVCGVICLVFFSSILLMLVVGFRVYV